MQLVVRTPVTTDVISYSPCLGPAFSLENSFLDVFFLVVARYLLPLFGSPPASFESGRKELVFIFSVPRKLL